MNTHILILSMAVMFFLGGLTLEENPYRIYGTDGEISAPYRTVVINSNDQMRFDVSEIRVKAGEKIRLTLNHTGKLPKRVMGHNFVLLTQGTDITKFSQAAMNAKNNEYIPSTEVIAYTKLIGGGESTTIEFTAPSKGTYDFICSFPGHYGIMKGKFIVE